MGTVDPLSSTPERGRCDVDSRSVPEPSLDAILGVLSNERRRRVLRHLADGPERRGLGEVAEAIAAEENGTAADEVTSSERKRVYIGLYQSHLPKMDAAAVVDYDEDRKLIEQGPHFRAAHDSLVSVEAHLSSSVDGGNGTEPSMVASFVDFVRTALSK